MRRGRDLRDYRDSLRRKAAGDQRERRKRKVRERLVATRVRTRQSRQQLEVGRAQAVVVLENSKIKQAIKKNNKSKSVSSASKLASRLKRINRALDKYVRFPKIYVRRDEYVTVFKNYFGGKNVLDIGCNTGFFSFFIGVFASHVVGVDISTKAIHKARKAKKRLGVKNLNFYCEDAANLTEEFMKSNSIECVFWHKVGGALKEERSRKLAKLFMSTGVSCIVSNGSVSGAENSVKLFYDNTYKCKQLAEHLVVIYRMDTL